MFVLLERPSTTKKIGLLARQNGQYTRPIIGTIIDFRVEDFLPDQILHSMRGNNQVFVVNFIGRLPNIPQINQTNRYFIATFNDVSSVTASQEEVDQLLATGQYLLLPDNPDSELWQHTRAPWWEWAVVLDEYNGFIKAPKSPRANEPSPEEADERIDDFEENRNKIKVVAPSTLMKWQAAGVQESYRKRLDRI